MKARGPERLNENEVLSRSDLAVYPFDTLPALLTDRLH